MNEEMEKLIKILIYRHVISSVDVEYITGKMTESEWLEYEDLWKEAENDC